MTVTGAAITCTSVASAQSACKCMMPFAFVENCGSSHLYASLAKAAVYALHFFAKWMFTHVFLMLCSCGEIGWTAINFFLVHTISCLDLTMVLLLMCNIKESQRVAISACMASHANYRLRTWLSTLRFIVRPAARARCVRQSSISSTRKFGPHSSNPHSRGNHIQRGKTSTHIQNVFA